MNIVDELVVRLGLDSSGFTKGVANVGVDTKKISDSATKTADSWEAGTKRIVAGFSKFRNELVGIIALVTGITGLQKLAADVQNANAALGHQATQLGVTSEALYGLQIAAEKAGSSASTVVGDVAKLQEAYQESKVTGDTAFAGPAAALDKLGVKLTDSKGHLRSWIDIAHDASVARPDLSLQDRYALLRQAGISKDTTDTFRNPNYQRFTDEAQGLAPTKAATEAAQRLKNAWVTVSEVVQNFVSQVLTKVEPYVTKIVDAFAKWYEASQQIISSKINEFFALISDFFNKTDWSEVGSKLKSAGNDLVTIARAIRDITEGIASFIRQVGDFKNRFENFFGKPDDTDGTDVPASEPDPQNPTGPVAWINRQLGTTPWDPSNDARPLSGDTTARANDVVTYLMGRGLSREVAAGIAGNIQQESSFNPASGAGTAHQGLAQWDATRRAEIERRSGKPLVSMSVHEQLDALVDEYQRDMPTQFGYLKGSQSAREAAIRFNHDFERSGEDQSNPGGMARTRNAERIYAAPVVAGPRTVPADKPASPGPRVAALSPYAELLRGLRSPGIAPMPAAQSFAPPSPAMFVPTTTNNDNSKSANNSTSVQTGDIIVHTRAADANGVGEAIKRKLAEMGYANQAQGALA